MITVKDASRTLRENKTRAMTLRKITNNVTKRVTDATTANEIMVDMNIKLAKNEAIQYSYNTAVMVGTQLRR